MIPLSQLLPFAATAFVIIVIPGPSVLFVVSRGMSHGRRAALASVAGNASGEYLQVVVVALGFAALLQRSEALFTFVKLGGAAYLVYLGLRAFLERHSADPREQGGVPDNRLPRMLREGFIVGATNPKVTLFFAAVLPQFVEPASGHLELQMLTLGLAFIVIALFSDSAWAIAAGSARDWLGRTPRRMEVIRGIGGLSIAGLGIHLALTGRRS